MLADMLDTAERHGVTGADLDGVLGLPGGCLDAVSSTVDRDARKVTAEQVPHLLGLVALALAELGATVRGCGVALAEPPAITGARAPLMVRLIPGDGWTLTFDSPRGVPVVLLSAGLGDVDAAAVAYAVELVHTNQWVTRRDVFDGRR